MFVVRCTLCCLLRRTGEIADRRFAIARLEVERRVHLLVSERDEKKEEFLRFRRSFVLV